MPWPAVAITSSSSSGVRRLPEQLVLQQRIPGGDPHRIEDRQAFFIAGVVDGWLFPKPACLVDALFYLHPGSIIVHDRRESLRPSIIRRGSPATE